jgi:hypothetical protein
VIHLSLLDGYLGILCSWILAMKEDGVLDELWQLDSPATALPWSNGSGVQLDLLLQLPRIRADDGFQAEARLPELECRHSRNLVFLRRRAIAG